MYKVNQRMKKRAIPILSPRTQITQELAQNMWKFVPNSVKSIVMQTSAIWIGHLRHVSIVFAKLPFNLTIIDNINNSNKNNDTAIGRLRSIFKQIQQIFYDFGANMIQFFIDDKGMLTCCYVSIKYMN